MIIQSYHCKDSIFCNYINTEVKEESDGTIKGSSVFFSLFLLECTFNFFYNITHNERGVSMIYHDESEYSDVMEVRMSRELSWANLKRKHEKRQGCEW